MPDPKPEKAKDPERDRDHGFQPWDAAIVGDPNNTRFATGRRNVDVTHVGPEILRGRRDVRERE